MMSSNISRKTWDTSGSSSGASCSVNVDESGTLKGSHRSGVVGSDKGTTFLIGFKEGDSKSRQIPKRLQQYEANKKTTSEADVVNKQKLAEERKKRLDENKARQARMASEAAMRELDRIQTRDNQSKWYQGALPK